MSRARTYNGLIRKLKKFEKEMLEAVPSKNKDIHKGWKSAIANFCNDFHYELKYSLENKERGNCSYQKEQEE